MFRAKSATGLVAIMLIGLIFPTDLPNPALASTGAIEIYDSGEESPSNLHQNSSGPRSISIAWDPPVADVEAVTDYKIEYSMDDISWELFSDGVDSTPFATIEELDPNLNYVVRVSALRGRHESAPAYALGRALEVTSGEGFTCSLGETKIVKCWGLNDSGQLGDGTFVSRYTPQVVKNLPPIIRIASGLSHTCAISENRNVYCWGGNQFGQLGNQTNVGSNLPVQVSGISEVAQISLGSYHSCAITMSQSVYCWGRNSSKQLANDYVSYSSLPLPVSGVNNVSKIVTGKSSTCVLDEMRLVSCWGSNLSGQLGVSSSSISVATPSAVGGALRFKDIQMGFEHVCATSIESNIYCWGSNSNGQIGNGSSSAQTSPTYISTPQFTPYKLQLGANSSCAIDSVGNTICWGSNSDGQLGLPALTNYRTPTQVVREASNLISLSSSHSCILKNDSQVYCMGSNSVGQLSTDKVNQTSAAVHVAVFHKVMRTTQIPKISNVSLSSTMSTIKVQWDAVASLGIQNEFKVNLYDDSSNLVLSQSTYNNVLIFSDLVPLSNYEVTIKGVNPSGEYLENNLQIATTAIPDILNITTKSRGVNKVIISWDRPLQDSEFVDDYKIRMSEDAFNWVEYNDGVSKNNYSEIRGLNTGETYHFEVAAVVNGRSGKYSGSSVPADLSSVLDLGITHSCAVVRLKAWCWGGNSFGQLGVGSNLDSSAPVQVHLDSVTKIAVGDYHTCALTISKEVYCWGQNNMGQLGSNLAGSTPSKVDLTDVVAITAGGSHTCALTSSKTVYCWGANWSGQVGVGDDRTQTFRTPRQVYGLENAVEIAAGTNHTCAKLSQGSVKCWGEGRTGEIGWRDYGLYTAWTPLTVDSLENVEHIYVGSQTSCALLADSSTWCWGLNNYSQMGYQLKTTTPKNVGWANGATSLAVGKSHICATFPDKSVQCSGRNDKGQFGNGGYNGRSSLEVVTNAQGSIFIVAGGDNEISDSTCAIDSEGLLSCWGSGLRGQIGNGLLENRNIPTKTSTPEIYFSKGFGSAPAVVPVLSNGGVVVSRSSAAVSWLSDDGGLPASFEVQLSEDGNVWGAVKVASATSYSFTGLLPGKNYWVRVRGVNDVGSSVSLLNLAFKTISLDLPQSLRVTGRGVGSVSLAWDKPAQDPDLVDDYQILYSLDGSVWNTFIDGVSNQTTAIVTGLETGKTYYFKIAAVASGQLSAEIGVKSLPSNTYGLITAGGSHMCAILEAVLTCWGSNKDGQLAALPTSESAQSVHVALDNVVQVAAGGSHTCAIVVTKEVYCWGLNTSGQLGNGSWISSWIPVKVLGINNATSISLGNSHSCAVLTDKTVKCWGMNSDGRLGDGSVTNRNYPVVAKNQIDVKSIVAGYSHTCSLGYSGIVKCWGSNLAGQTGGSRLSSLGSATEIATQGDFSCALLIDKTIWCWGWNNGKQIVGNGSNIIPSPTRLAWADGAISVDTGNDHVCIVTSEGSIKCVGWNNVGQLGDGTNLNRTLPITVPLVAGATRVFMGGGGWGADFTCAIGGGQKVLCWGDNSSGQVNLSAPSEFVLSPTVIQHLWIGLNARSADNPRTGLLSLSATATTLQARIEIQDDGGIPTQCRFSLTSAGIKSISSQWLEVSDFTFAGLKEKTLYKVQARCRNGVGEALSSPIASKKTGALSIFPTIQLPTIIGKHTKGSILSLKLGAYLEGVAITFAWKINGVLPKNGLGSTFIVPPGNKGKKITVTVIAKKADYKDLSLTSKPFEVTS